MANIPALQQRGHMTQRHSKELHSQISSRNGGVISHPHQQDLHLGKSPRNFQEHSFKTEWVLVCLWVFVFWLTDCFEFFGGVSLRFDACTPHFYDKRQKSYTYIQVA